MPNGFGALRTKSRGVAAKHLRDAIPKPGMSELVHHNIDQSSVPRDNCYVIE